MPPVSLDNIYLDMPLIEQVQKISNMMGLSKKEIAQSIGYSREAFSTIINREEHHDKIEALLRSKYPEMYNVTATKQIVVKQGNDLEKRMEQLERELAEIKERLRLITLLLEKR